MLNKQNRTNSFSLYRNYILHLLPKDIFKIVNTQNSKNFNLYFNSNEILYVISFFMKHYLFRFRYFIDLSCVDLFNNLYRFQLTYFFVSIPLNSRIALKTFLKDSQKINSISLLFAGASWYEREVWDMFGIQFFNHPDLRRLLTDYFFSGFPLRKDFPVTGYLELRYHENLKKIKYQPLKLIQEFRAFDTISPWKQLTMHSNFSLYHTYKHSKILHLDTILPSNII